MVHTFFLAIVASPAFVDEWFGMENAPKFTDVFRNLFPEVRRYSENVASYLDAIASDFTFNNKKIRIPNEIRSLVERFFKSLGLKSTLAENRHVFLFCMYLVKLYQATVETGSEPRDDNVFGFMEGFPIHHTKMVLIGKDPSINVPSTGYAFHGSRCPSTRTLLDLLNQEMQRIQRVLPPGSVQDGLALSSEKLEGAKENCSLISWIQQNVLLINSWLSYDQDLWTPFSNFLVRYLSKELDTVSFILMGKVALNKQPLIDHHKHSVIRVHHPSHINRRTRPSGHSTAYLEWDRAMPFINANFYWYQVSRGGTNNNSHEGMVDWSNWASGKQVSTWNPDHLEIYTELFEKAIQAKDIQDLETGRNDRHAFICLPGSSKKALLIKRCYNGKLIIRKSYGWRE